MSKSQSVVIIGAGISGLAAGVQLARQGLRVKILEANGKAGGCCATTNHDGYLFSDGALWLVAIDVIDHAFRRMGLDRNTELPLRKIVANMTTRLPGGAQLTVGKGTDVTLVREGRAVDAAILQHEIEQLLRRWVPAFRPFLNDLFRHPFSLVRMLRKSWRHLPKLTGTVAGEMKRLFSDEEMRAAMSGALLYSGLAPEEMPASQLLGLVAMFTEGYYLPEGGMGQVPVVLSGAFRQHGGELLFNTPVSRILVKNGRAGGVEIEGQDFIEADFVLSTVGGMTTFLTLMDEQDVPPKILSQARNAPLSWSTFNIQLGLANQIDVKSHLNYVLPMMERQHTFLNPSTEDMGSLIYLVPTLTMPELAPPGGSIVEMFVPIQQNLPLAAWDESRTATRAEAAVSELARLHHLDVRVKRVRSPKLFAEDLNLYDGRVYGLSPAVGPGDYFPHKTTLPGLLLAGQTTYPGYGVAAAMMSGILAAETLAAH